MNPEFNLEFLRIVGQSLSRAPLHLNRCEFLTRFDMPSGGGRCIDQGEVCVTLTVSHVCGARLRSRSGFDMIREQPPCPLRVSLYRVSRPFGPGLPLAM